MDPQALVTQMFGGRVTIVSSASGPVQAQNLAPNLRVQTSPSANYSTNPPTISGTPPLTVSFNLCPSDDPDSGDSLNWQFNFGDSGVPPFNSDGSFNRDTDQQCRVQHTYREGVYTTWVSVTDKHLEDQSRGAGSLARKSQAFTIKAEFERNQGCQPLLDLGGPATVNVTLIAFHRYEFLVTVNGAVLPGFPTILITPVTFTLPLAIPPGFYVNLTDLDCGLI